MRQRAWCCRDCGSDEFYLRDLCKPCYETWKRDHSRFGGMRHKALTRDGHCRFCLECRWSHLVVHHEEPGRNALDAFSTLCRGHHNAVHKTKALRYVHTAEFRRLWRKLHGGKPEQMPLDFVTPAASAEQQGLFTAA